jgi:RNA polymerase sigma-70 factor (ECF subfamily)
MQYRPQTSSADSDPELTEILDTGQITSDQLKDQGFKLYNLALSQDIRRERAAQVLLGNSSYLHHFATSLTKSRDEAEEIVQETFFRMFKNTTPPKKGNYIKYTLSAVYYTFIDSRRKWGRQSVFYDGAPLTNEPREEGQPYQFEIGKVVDPGDSPEDNAALNQKVEAVYDVVGELSPRQRQITMLHYYHFLKIRQIADKLEISVGTVKATLHHARTNLRLSLEERLAS